jgi:hypothetical protein
MARAHSEVGRGGMPQSELLVVGSSSEVVKSVQFEMTNTIFRIMTSLENYKLNLYMSL